MRIIKCNNNYLGNLPAARPLNSSINITITNMVACFVKYIFQQKTVEFLGLFGTCVKLRSGCLHTLNQTFMSIGQLT